MLSIRLSMVVSLLLIPQGAAVVRGQEPIGFIEKFATAPDRRVVLDELIPGTEDYFYFHALHYQNTGQVADAHSALEAWRTKFGDGPRVANMFARQQLLEYATNPQQTLQFLRTELGLALDHAPPARDRAAALPNALDNAQLEVARLVDQSLTHDRSLSQIETHSLGLLLGKQLTVEQLRALLGRLDRSDQAGLVARIAEELSLKDSPGFGWAGVHALLTLEQLQELLKQLPSLLENDVFVRAITARLAPAAGNSLADKAVLRSYLQRLNEWGKQLPPSQNSFKALVLGNLLRLDLSEAKWDRERFIAYLKLPRSAAYYEPRRLVNLGGGLVQLDFVMNPQVPLPAMGDDSQLVQRYLEHFFQTEDAVDDFAPYLKREYLERVLAHTKILYGLGDEAKWYNKLTAGDQKELRERVEVRFAPHNPQQFSTDDAVRLEVELKNVDQLLVKIYDIDLLNYYRSHAAPPGTDIDLDGLVPNHQRQLRFSQPAQRRHSEQLDFPEFMGRGTWVVDLLGAGQRSRAVIQKGRLLALERLGDAGQVFEIVDETGARVVSAHIELEGRKYQPDEQGKIILPYAEQDVARQLLLVDGDFVSPLSIAHRAEEYQLRAGFLVNRQSLVAGTQAVLAIRARLTCNGRPISVRLMEEAKLSIVATDAEGIVTTQLLEALDLDDGDELVHRLLVPPRLARLSLVLSGKVANRSRDRRDEVSAGYELSCNGIQQSNQIADFYLRETSAGYRLLVLGRNGEPIPRMPVSLSLKLRPLTNRYAFTLATNAAGEVDLGQLETVTDVDVSAANIQASHFAMTRFHRHWPATIQVGRDETISLPLGKEAAERSQFSLFEFRRDVPTALLAEALTIESGKLQIAGLAAGDYVLQDHETGQRVSLRVGDAQRRDNFVAAPHRLLQASLEPTLVIREAKLENGSLRVRVDGANPLTRVHIVANPLKPDVVGGQQIQLPQLTLMSRGLPPTLSYFVDSLRLDEEYSYILSRQSAKKYPGNLLPQPTLLIQPWQVSVTENLRQDASAGDAMPKSAAPPAAQSRMQAEAERLAEGARPDWKSFDFLSQGSLILANQALEDGQLVVPLENLGGFSSLTVLVVHPTASDSRSVVQDAGELKVRDQRLREAFDPEVHLAQLQKVEQLAAGEKKSFGDPRTRRLQTYATIADVFQLYQTLLGNPEWEKFRFVSRWHELSETERLARYNEMACHELNFFLYHKDRSFFDRVIKPLLANKLDKQLVDLWLLGESLEAYTPLWRVQRLNTLERILLAAHLESQQAGTERWLREFLQAHPLPPTVRQQRFEIALRGTALETDAGSGAQLNYAFESMGMMGGGAAGGVGGAVNGPAEPDNLRALSLNGASESRRARGRPNRQQDGVDAKDKAFLQDEFFGVDRLGRSLGEDRLFQTLDKTREWAETQYYHVRLSNQSTELIPPNPFWQEFLAAGSKPFLPRDLDLPCGSLNEALCALAVTDLPLKRTKLVLHVEDEQLIVESETAAVVYLESIEATGDPLPQKTVMVGQDIYVASPSTDEESNLPVAEASLLTGIPYRTSVVVTNPTGRPQRVQVLTQLPAGSLPLAGSKLTRSTALELSPYSTSQVEYVFYFPEVGEFAHYGAQVSSEERHIAASASALLRVAAEPESVDETTWSYIADWGTDAQVLQFLGTANLQRIDLSRIAFRMHDPKFYRQVTQLLQVSGRFDATLWAYAIVHDDRVGMTQLLQNRPDFLARLGAALHSTLVEFDPQQQMSYEHLDYKPLVVARSHQLGREPVILNPSLHRQYLSLLDVIAHQPQVSNDARLQLCYYMLIQNRITEALEWLAAVEPEQLVTRMQYDYFDAYLDFYRGDIERAAKIAAGYQGYPVPRWADLFAQIRQQVATHRQLLQGDALPVPEQQEVTADAEQRLLTDQRSQQQSAGVAKMPALDLENRDGRLTVRFRNLDQVQVNYYLMDIELLFSRNPFVSQGAEQVPAIRPNLSQQVSLSAADGVANIELAPEMQNRNLLIEVSAAGISRSTWLTASSLTISLSEPMGRVQVLSQSGKLPVAAAYVKVFARHGDGTVKFYKDGYTDLNGIFDYATLSTSDLDTAQRLAILVIDEKLGAVVKEASPPTR